MRIFSFLIIITGFLILSCGKTPGPAPMPQPDTSRTMAKGADISWITEMEAAGRKFYTTTGIEQDLFRILKDLGLNTVRIRVWVNPVDGWNGKADVVAKALRAKALGFRLLINFHYSDSWADPGQQTKPASWSGDFNSLKSSLSAHTSDVLQALKNAGVTPEWVQVGNETNNGLLWPDGRASSNMNNYAQLVTAGYEAVKAVFPETKVIVHLSNGWDNQLFRWNLDGLKNNGGKWDITGMSLYPSPSNWETLAAQCQSNMMDMATRYGKEVIIVEVGMSWDQATICKSFIADLLDRSKTIPDKKGLGVIYWEPESYNNWKGYTLGAFDNSGKPTVALDAFK